MCGPVHGGHSPVPCDGVCEGALCASALAASKSPLKRNCRTCRIVTLPSNSLSIAQMENRSLSLAR
jgi:hypothetical protein